jgi:hypothetical protein
MDAALKETLRFARLPFASHKLRLANYGPTMATLAKALAGDGRDAVLERLERGAGWIIQGEPVRALEATQALLKAFLLVGQAGVYINGFGPHMLEVSDDDRRLDVVEAKIWAVARFFDRSYRECPYTDRERFETENFMLNHLGDCTPVLHCLGKLTDCKWYSDELTARLLSTCEVVTV